MKANWFVAYKVELPKLDLSLIEAEQVRWFQPADFHVTLVFLGGLNEAQIGHAKSLFADFPAKPFDLPVKAFTTLPPGPRFSALCLQLQADPDWSDHVVTARKHFLVALNLPPETREPLPHITLARPLRQAGHQQRAKIQSAWCALQPPEIQVHLGQLALYTWNEDRQVRQFQEVCLVCPG
ncbi:MAG: hypothetical protein H6510_16815 [Acidobacteria bacterium]|nr:hypothetical protein [Acidobacteriota bacterium]MCB9399476.1 hypothetical protein [Acidobacteriota bacterium]